MMIVEPLLTNFSEHVLTKKIKNNVVREAISKNIPVIMQEFLNLTNAIDADILSNVMQEFIEIFAVQVTPFAVEIATQLRNTWSRLLQDLSNQETGLDQNDEEKSAKILAIMGIMRSINSLVLGLEASSNTLVQVQHLLLPVFINVLENRTVDIYPELIEMVDTCIGTMQRVEPDMWKIYELLYATRDIAVEYMPELSTLLEHYIEMGSQVFCTREDYKRIAFELIENVLNKEFATDKDRTCACRLIQYILLTCRGSVDQVRIKHYKDKVYIVTYRDFWNIVFGAILEFGIPVYLYGIHEDCGI